MAKGTYADNSTRKCVIYCPLGSFANPNTQICVSSTSDLIKFVRLCPVCSAATSPEPVSRSATGVNTQISRRDNAPAYVPIKLTEIIQLADVSQLVLPASPPSQTHSLVSASKFVPSTTMVTSIHASVSLA